MKLSSGRIDHSSYIGPFIKRIIISQQFLTDAGGKIKWKIYVTECGLFVFDSFRRRGVECFSTANI